MACYVALRRLAINSSILGAGAYLAQAGTVVIYVVAARHLGPGLFGPILGAIGLVIVLGSFADFGMNALALRTLARIDNDPAPFVRTFSAKAVIALTLALGWAFVSWLIARGPDRAAIVLLAAYVASVIVASTIEVPFRALQRMDVVAALNVTERITALTLVFCLFGLFRPDPILLSISLIGGSLTTGIVGLVLLDPTYRQLRAPTLGEIGRLWRDSFSFGMLGLATQIQRADVAIVNAVSGPLAAGVYAAPSRLVGFFSVLPGAFSTAMFPRVASAAKRATVHREVITGAIVMMTVLGVGLIGTYVLAPIAVHVVLGVDYLQSVPVLRAYLVAFALIAANQVMAMFLQAEGEERFVGITAPLGIVVGLVGIAIGSAVGGPVGAAFGAIPGQALMGLCFVARSFYVVKQTAVREAGVSLPARSG